ncbi:NodT family efflux transporter outer membrane factor (OMF) lipoprotein [Sphingomonas naasensis]|uniref:TolC family protein n=1 Tax=Sphingomonas naasensis TaxID=1344951 RepID=A0A4V3QXC2_9SPHN|nr:TolC family protein [Sphingomonas naasensis]NIJ18706.1 NodT family efflux transporter outer membrane factor (OMF) lipoprotein [Sphingomonas naasensis]TGX45942.1 TolC family protein [Sphingomonas naasensis]
MKRLSLLAAGLLSACAVGPNYERPATPQAAAGTFVDPGTTKVSTGAVEGEWWHLFRDPVLDRLVVDALAHNTDIRVAAANLRRVRAVLSEARNQRLPTTDLSARYTRQRVGAGSSQIPGVQSQEFDFFQVGFDAGYQVDLFGGVSRSIEAARGDVAAAQAGLDAARIAIAAETARTYAQACSFAAQAAVARETAALQEQTLGLTRRLLEAGRGTQRDVDQTLVLAENARAQVPLFEAERRAALYALATLTGRPPEETDAAAAQCTVPPQVTGLIPVGDGAALLARRPDVRQAERTLAADTARVGVATAALYPSIRLLGSVSLGAQDIGDLAKKDSFSFSLGPLISWSFPNMGQARSRLRQAEATAEGSLATFDGTVLTALREVEQALARYSGEIERNVALRRAEAAASNAARIAGLRFSAGRDTLLQRIDAERDRAGARAALAQSNAALAEAQVALFNALGGGWENAPAAQRREPVATN